MIIRDIIDILETHEIMRVIDGEEQICILPQCYGLLANDMYSMLTHKHSLHPVIQREALDNIGEIAKIMHRKSRCYLQGMVSGIMVSRDFSELAEDLEQNLKVMLSEPIE